MGPTLDEILSLKGFVIVKQNQIVFFILKPHNFQLYKKGFV